MIPADERSMDLEEEECSQLPSTHKTFYISLSELMDFDLTDSMIYISWETVHYVMKVISKQMPTTICPLRVPGDGNCLLHAVSHALWGRVSYHEALRQLLKQELAEHEEFYRHSVDKLKEDEESQGYSKEEFEKIVGDASSTHACLEFIHIFAISNVLKRPIVVYAGDDDLKAWGVHEEGCAGTFLPTRHGAQECCGPPITLGWSNAEKNHFVPFCPVKGSKPEWPTLDVVFKKTLRNGETAEDYFRNGNNKLLKKRKKSDEENLIKMLYNFCKEQYDSYETTEQMLKEPGYTPKQLKALENTFLKIKLDALQKGLYSPPKTKQIMIHIKEPETSCKYIPFTDPYIVVSTSSNIYKNMLEKILQFNDELHKTKPEQKLTFLKAFRHTAKVDILTPFQIGQLEMLFKVLHSKDFCSAHFDPASLELVGLMLTWPLDMLWPVIDLARVLILYQSAAEYYVRQSSKINIFTILLNLIHLNIDNSFNNKLLAVKFSLNLFKQPCNQPMLVMYSKTIITVLLMCIKELNYTPDQNIKIFLVITQIFMNFVSMWWKEGQAVQAPDHNESVVTLINWSLEVLQDPQTQQNTELLYRIMVILGTLLRCVGRTTQLLENIRPKIGKLKLLPEILGPFRNFPEDLKIRECTVHILDCIGWQEERMI